jgi:hypothetical protein
MKIRLPKPFILRAYCFTVQGERSIAFALGAPWAELREYYYGEKIVGLRLLVDDFMEILTFRGVQFPALGRNEVSPFWNTPGLWKCLFGKWVSRWKNHWSFPAEMLAFMAMALQSLARFLDSEARPGQEELISLRMDLCTSRSAIESRCFGLSEIQRARRIEHFWQADWITPVTLEDILGKPITRSEWTPRKTA